MISETLNFSETSSISIYGGITGMVLIFALMGGTLGDLLKINKQVIIIGGILQTLGAFVMAIPHSICFYIGLLLFFIGSGLYSPNILGDIGKLLKPFPKFLDSGFTLLYILVILGAAFGVFLIGYLGNIFFSLGFFVAGILSLISVGICVLNYFVFPKETVEITGPKVTTNYSIVINGFIIITLLILTSFFWGSYEIASIWYFEINQGLSSSGLPSINNLSFFSNMIIIPFSLGAMILWYFLKGHQILKLLLGFLFFALAFGIIVLSEGDNGSNPFNKITLVIICLTIGEAIIAPIALSIITKYSNPKYLAIMMAIYSLPIMLVSKMMHVTNYLPIFNGISIHNIVLLAVVLIIFGLTPLYFIMKWLVKPVVGNSNNENYPTK